jgi:hypothetical protein
MAADITRSTFNPLKHYSGVRQQQGRVSIDADSNEQVDIASHRVQIETSDVVGFSGAPRDNAGFQIVPVPQSGVSSDLAISPGRIYVNGTLCELESTPVPIVAIIGTSQAQVTNMVADGREFAAGQWVEVSAQDSTAPSPLVVQIQSVSVATQTLTLPPSVAGFAGKTGPQLQRITTYLTQPDLVSPAPLPTSGFALVYLDVWERVITALEDPEIRELALGQSGGVDTATRTKTIWQVKLNPVSIGTTCASAPSSGLIPQTTAQLAARSEPTPPSTGACILPPTAGYRSLENQLYRVEIHAAGSVGTGDPTFKWSRDNASVVTAITSPAPALSGTTITINVKSLGRDQVLGFASGQWVELTDDGRELAGAHGILVQLTAATAGPQGPILIADTTLADPVDLSNFLNTFANQTVRNPKVRRWDQSGTQVSSTTPGGDVAVQEGTWIDLENGVQVFFQPGGVYLTGDHWLIPARTVTGDVDWPRDSAGDPQPAASQSSRHHYCRLGIVNFGASAWTLTSDCRQIFPPLADGGMHITQVYLSNASPISPNGGLLLNDGTVSLQDLAGGISVICDTPIDPISILSPPAALVGKPACVVTIDVPNIATGAPGPFAQQTFVVCATLGLDSAVGNTIKWNPTSAAASWLQSQLPSVLSQTPAPGPLLAHLRLKGNVIWARGNPSLLLDGDSFGSPAAPDPTTGFQRTDVLLPSGDGKRGGDFEMWFWLISLPAVVVSPTSINFPNQVQGIVSAPVALTLTNNSPAPLTISSIVPTGDFAQTTNCPLTSTQLAESASCTINVTFTPTLAGLRTGAVTISHSAAGSPLVIQLSGVGLAPALQASATTVALTAIVGTSTAADVVLTNIGSAPLIISAIAKSGLAEGDYTLTSSCVPAAGASTVLQPGTSCTLGIIFIPAAVGLRIATVLITHNAAGSPLPITLQGMGIPPPAPPTRGPIGIVGIRPIEPIEISELEEK